MIEVKWFALSDEDQMSSGPFMGMHISVEAENYTVKLHCSWFHLSAVHEISKTFIVNIFIKLKLLYEDISNEWRYKQNK